MFALVLAITFLLAFVATIGFAAYDDGVLAAITSTIAAVSILTLTVVAITAQHTADMDARAANCEVMWEGATTDAEIVERIASVCNIDDTRAERIHAGVVAEFTR